MLAIAPAMVADWKMIRTIMPSASPTIISETSSAMKPIGAVAIGVTILFSGP